LTFKFIIKSICQDLRKDHFERLILQSLDEVVIQQALLELIDGATGLGRQVLESDPNQEGTADVVALNPGLAALAAFQPCHLLAFAVQL
jgi:hypothetical protein